MDDARLELTKQERKRERIKKYKERKKDEIREQNKNYRERKKDEINEKGKARYRAQKEKILAQKRKWNENNPEAVRAIKRSWYHNNPQDQRRILAFHHIRLEQSRLALGGVCARCGNIDQRVMHFTHIDPAIKKYNVGQMWNASDSTFWQEVTKCQLLCANCHH